MPTELGKPIYYRYGMSNKEASRRKSLRYGTLWRRKNFDKLRSIRWRHHQNRANMYLYCM